MILALRAPYRPGFVRSGIRVRVGASDLGDVYKDDNGKLWMYDIWPRYPTARIRAYTDQYGGKTSPWFDEPLLPGHDHDEVNQWIDVQAGLEAVLDTTIATAAKKKTAPKPIAPASRESTLAGTPGEPGSAAPSSSSSLGTAIAVGILLSALAMFLLVR